MPARYLETTVDKFTFRVAADRRYSQDGVWVEDLAPGRVRVGVTDFVQQHSGDIAFAVVRPVRTVLAAGEEFADLETVKVNLSLPLPVAGTVVEVNPALGTRPEVISEDPYGEGWLAVIEVTALETDRAALLDPPSYLSIVESQARQEVDNA
jgi:glycine cleavage system H protein